MGHHLVTHEEQGLTCGWYPVSATCFYQHHCHYAFVFLARIVYQEGGNGAFTL